MGAERRQWPRLATSIWLDLRTDRQSITAITRDVSLGGLFVRTDADLPVGTEVDLRLHLFGQAYPVDGKIVWALSSQDGRRIGVGVCFLDPSPTLHDALQALMAKQHEARPEPRPAAASPTVSPAATAPAREPPTAAGPVAGPAAPTMEFAAASMATPPVPPAPALSTDGAAQTADAPAADAAAPGPRIWVYGAPAQRELDPRLQVLLSPNSMQTASFRTLRNRLAEQGDPRTVLVTSPSRCEGKTTVAINLAVQLAKRDKVLFLEANLQRPAVAAIFGFTPPECLFRQIARHQAHPLEPWKVVEVVHSLHVLATDPKSTSQGLSLNELSFQKAMESLKQSDYAHIIIDAPSLDDSPDLNLIEDAVDGVLLVARAGVSSEQGLRTTADRLTRSKILGLAFFDA